MEEPEGLITFYRVYRIPEATMPITAELVVEAGTRGVPDALGSALEQSVRSKMTEHRMDTGIVASLAQPGGKPGPCYFALTCGSRHVVALCMQRSRDGDFLESFRAELTSFVRDTRPILDSLPATPPTPADAQQLDSFLSKWFDVAIAFMTRIVQGAAAEESLARIVQASVLGLGGQVAPPKGITASDFGRFSSVLRVIPPPAQRPLIDLLGDDVPVAPAQQLPAKVDPVCINWAEQLVAASRGDALSLRSAMEGVKVAATKHLNATRKLLTLAATSHHALYQCVVTLRESPARGIIRGLLLGDTSSVTPQQQEVLTATLRLVAMLDQRDVAQPQHQETSGLHATLY